MADAAVFETTGVASAEPVAEAAPAFQTPVASVIRAPRAPAKASVRRVAVVRADATALPPVTAVAVKRGGFVVQLGAFASQSGAERAWGAALRRFGLGRYAPVSGTARVRNAPVHRLAVAGFAKRDDADRMCARIKATRGTCFVRVQSGDAVASWTKRAPAVRMASR